MGADARSRQPAPVSAETLRWALAEPDRARLARALPCCRTPAETRSEFEATGLRAPTHALLALSGPRGRYLAEVFAPDWPPVATTLGVALAAIDHPEPGLTDADAPALRALIDHLFRTTAIVRAEVACAASDDRARAACLAAGLAFESLRRSALGAGSWPEDAAVYRLLRSEFGPEPQGGSPCPTAPPSDASES